MYIYILKLINFPQPLFCKTGVIRSSWVSTFIRRLVLSQSYFCQWLIDEVTFAPILFVILSGSIASDVHEKVRKQLFFFFQLSGKSPACKTCMSRFPRLTSKSFSPLRLKASFHRRSRKLFERQISCVICLKEKQQPLTKIPVERLCKNGFE